MIWIFTFKKWIGLNVQVKRILILYTLNIIKNILAGKNGPEMFFNLEKRIFVFLILPKEDNGISGTMSMHNIETL